MTRQLTRAELIRFAKYMAGGGAYFWIGYGVFALGYSGLGWPWLPAKIAADVIGWSANYAVQRLWAFSDRATLGEMQHASRYVIIESIGFVLDYLIIWGLNHIGITPYIGFFISSAFFTVWSYFWYKYWVFPEATGAADLAAPDTADFGVDDSDSGTS